MDLNKQNLRWLLLVAVTLIVLVIRTVQYGFFQGKDWLLYFILIASIFFALKDRK